MKKHLGDGWYFDTKATMADFEYIRSWMTEGFKQGLKGYTLYHNLDNSIRSSFEKKKAVVLRYNAIAEGYISYSLDKETRTIMCYTMAISPRHARQGHGTQLMKAMMQYFSHKCAAMVLFDVNPVSSKLGKKMGFRLYTHEDYKPYGYLNNMWNSLLPIRRQNKTAKRRLVVWDRSYADMHRPPLYSWSLNFKRDKKPIVHAVHPEWTIGIVEDGKLVREYNAKRFPYFLRGHGWFICVESPM